MKKKKQVVGNPQKVETSVNEKSYQAPIKTKEVLFDTAQRKRELIGRDLLSFELDNVIKEYVSVSQDKYEKLCEKMNSEKAYYKSGLKEKSDIMFKIKNKIKEKWNVDVNITDIIVHTEYVSRERPFWSIRVDRPPKVKEGERLSSFKGSDLIYIPDKNSKWVYAEKEYLPILINLSIIDKNDSKIIRKEVWNIVERHLNKQKSKVKQSFPAEEPKELAFLYHIKNTTFNNYLKWYDIHTKEKLSFRLIALIDKTGKTNPQKASEILERLKQKKIKWGIPIKGEDKIEKGVKLIYKTIHRTDYSQNKAEPLIEIDKLICPIHKNEACPINCSHLKKWINNFNRIYPVN